MEYYLQDVLTKIENDERILQFRFQYKNMLVWPSIRFNVLRMISNRRFNLTARKKIEFSKKQYIEKLIKCIKIGFKSPFFWGQKDFLYFYGTAGNVITSSGKVYNRVYDWFVMEYNEHSGVIETRGQTNYKDDKHVDKRYLDAVSFLIEILSYLKKPDYKDVLMADKLLDYLCNECRLEISEDEVKRFKKNILFTSKAIRYMDKIFPRLFHALIPKIVFIEDGCFGGRNAYLIKILHGLNIKTAEVQHGWIGKSHEAYVHSKFLCDSAEYASYMPDYFLGWSEYWLDKIAIPGDKIPIGNPQFWQQYQALQGYRKKRLQSDCMTILWIAFGDNDKNKRFLAEFIKASDNEYNIRIRLHPALRWLKREYEEYENNERIMIDELESIYDSLYLADYVIAETSTVIYEALAVGKPVFVLYSERVAAFELLDVAPVFKNVNELLDLLRGTDVNMYCNAENRKKYFGDMWQQKFHRFIRTIDVS